MRQLLLIAAIVLLIFAGVYVGLVEGGNAPSEMMPYIITAYLLSMGLWVYLTLSSQSWGSRLGGYVVIAVGCVILYFFLRANL